MSAAHPSKAVACATIRAARCRAVSMPATTRGLGRASYSHLARPTAAVARQSGRMPAILASSRPLVANRGPGQPRGQDQVRWAGSSSEPLMRTPLYEMHVEKGGKMVPFGGFEMPVQYQGLSIADSHVWTRKKASLFDVSHMVQHHITGPGAEGFLSRVTPAAVSSLKENHSTLAVLLHPETGGIVDDTIVTRLGPDHFYIVTNAACRQKDLEYLKRESADYKREAASAGKPADFAIATYQNEGLIALQGPLAAEILQEAVADSTDLSKLYFGQCIRLRVKAPGHSSGVEVLASRGGYTGEDGFELSVPGDSTVDVTQSLFDVAGPERLQLAGLGARDSLRIEAGMCLYGHDINDDTTPPEGGLAWVVAKERRAEGGFHGADRILGQLKKKGEDGRVPIRTRRVGFVVEGAPAREGATVLDMEDKEVGKITSGCPSPALGKNIAMGLVNKLMKEGTEVKVLVRNKPRKATVAKMPFVESKYYRG